ncbi:MAG: hypothetical protein ACT4O2_00695, partial [Beijerinckiaceae bacterium]
MSAGFDSGHDGEASGAAARPAGSRSILSARVGKSAPRIRLAAWVFLGLYGIIAGKLIAFGLRPDPPASFRRSDGDTIAAARP